MKKLFKQKSWLTLAEAAKYLSAVLSEEVSEADILQLALEMRLTLSANFINHAIAKIGRIVPLSECPSVELPALSLNGPTEKTITFYEGAVQLNDGTAVKLEPEVRTIHGIWDLPMIGGEYHTIEDRYQLLTGGPTSEMTSIDGAFVKSSDGTIAQLLERSEASVKGKKSARDPDSYWPAAELPFDCAIVVRPQCLRDLEARMMEEEGLAKDKPVLARERANLHRIIGAMLGELTSRVDPTTKAPANPRYKTQADLIAELMDLHPHKEGISRTTLENVFAEAKRTLDSD